MDYYFNISYESIKNFLIDDTIIINPNDTILNKIYKNIIKYRKLIALVLLILLIICGYLNRDLLFPSYSKKGIQQNGGATFTAAQLGIPTGTVSKAFEGLSKGGLKATMSKGAIAQAAKTAASSAAGAAGQAAAGAAGQAVAGAAGAAGEAAGGAAEKAAKKPGMLSKIGSTTKKYGGKGLKGLGKGAKYLGGKGYKVGAAGFQMFRDNSTRIYQFLFTIALALLVAILFFPALVLFIIYIICYLLFKKFMKSTKSL